MPESPTPERKVNDTRRGSIEIVQPYARIRVIIALIAFVVAIGVLAWRSLSG